MRAGASADALRWKSLASRTRPTQAEATGTFQPGDTAADFEARGVALSFPLIVDADGTVSDLYGMIHPNANDTCTVRAVLVIAFHMLHAWSGASRPIVHALVRRLQSRLQFWENRRAVRAARRIARSRDVQAVLAKRRHGERPRRGELP